MINIEKVDNGYSFPTIDFKFQNTGNATAFLWQFRINILSAEINPAPVIDFRSKTSDGSLQIFATNNGWGPARGLEVKLDEVFINFIFENHIRRYNDHLESGEDRMIFNLTKELAVDSLAKRSTPTQAQKLIKLGDLNLLWQCKDERGKLYENHNRLSLGSGRYLALSADGFVEIDENEIRIGGAADSDVTFVSLIDPLKGSHERNYSISRSILPGDIERFHIMVGALQSCKLLLKFSFSIDKSSILESPEFEIDIWNPRNSNKHYAYQDGVELDRRIKRLHELAEKSQLTFYQERELARRQAQLTKFPFSEPPEIINK